MYLSNKTNLLKSMLHKDQQMTLMDSVIRKIQGERRKSNNELESSVGDKSKTVGRSDANMDTHRTGSFEGSHESSLQGPSHEGERSDAERSAAANAGQDGGEQLLSGQASPSALMHKKPENEMLLEYYSPNFDCGFSGGGQMPTALGMA